MNDKVSLAQRLIMATLPKCDTKLAGTKYEVETRRQQVTFKTRRFKEEVPNSQAETRMVQQLPKLAGIREPYSQGSDLV